MTDLLKLISLCQNLECEYRLDAPMKEYTSFRIGGPCDILISPYDEGQIAALVRFLSSSSIRWQIIGNGTNLLVPDGGVAGAIIATGQNFSYIRKLQKPGEILCASGASLSSVASFAQKNGLSGMEFAWGIPGNIGGALFMNAGAYGGEMKDIVVSADYVDDLGTVRNIDVRDMQLGYRHSIFFGKNWCITKVILRLIPSDPEEIRAKMDEFMRLRKEKQPLEYPSAGSVFKRPEGDYAGALIERCGLKGRRIGDAQVSEKHAGFIVNLGNATARDVHRLIREIQDTVENKTGYKLECELRQL